MAWTKPPRGLVKANVDAAVFQNQGKIGACCIFIDLDVTMVMDQVRLLGHSQLERLNL